MRTTIAAVMAAGVLLVPTPGKTQTPQLPAGAPILYSGAYYYPSGPTVFFNGSVMVLSGFHEGVPIYVDATREPFHVVYVPVPGKLMRPYERRRDDEAADLVVPRAASLPPNYVQPGAGVIPGPAPAVAPATEAAIASILIPRAYAAHAARAIESIPPPNVSRGIWIEFDGRKWELAGRGPARPSTLTNIGSYHGFPVFQDRARRDQIFVPAVEDGPLVRYSLYD